MPSGPAALVVRTAVVAAIAFGATGCGDDDPGEPGPRATTTATGTAGRPFPTGDVTPLESGVTYTTRRFTPPLQITTTDEPWIAETGDRPNDFSLALDVPRGQAILGFHRAKLVVDPRRGAEKPGDRVPGPRDFAAWLRTHPHLRTTRPVPTTALGLRGVRIDVTVRSAPGRVPDDCGKFVGVCVALLHDGFDWALYPEDSKARFLVLDQGGRQLIIDEWVQPRRRFDRVVRDLDRQLRAIRVSP